jgi:hypothetical protein
MLGHSIVSQHGTRRFNTEFTRALHLFLSWARPIQSISPHPTYPGSILILSTHLRLGLPSSLFTSGFPTNNLYAFLFFPIRATWPAHLILLEFVLLPTASRPVRFGIGLPFGAHDQIWSSIPFDNYFVVLPRTPSLTRGWLCNLQCNRWLVRSLRTNNHTLPSHLRLCSLFVASYDSQGLWWRYSNPPPRYSSSSTWLF